MMGGCCGGLGFGGSFGIVGMLINLVVTLVVVGGVIWLVIWLVRRSAGGALFPQGKTTTPAGPSGAEASLSPKEALQLRYVRGEITREQYLSMLKDLE